MWGGGRRPPGPEVGPVQLIERDADGPVHPVLDGVEATRLLLLADQPEIRVVALTSFSDCQRVTDMLAAARSAIW